MQARLQKEMTINIPYEYGDLVYLKTDPDQLQRLVIGFNIRQTGFYVLLSCGTLTSEHYPVEITAERNILMSLGVDKMEHLK